MKRAFTLAGAVVALSSITAHAETTNCTPITSLPTVITTQGSYCLNQSLSTSMTSGNAITINTNNVTIDLNGFKLGGLGGGTSTSANGIYSADRQNITIRNGTIRGFRWNIALDGSGSGQLIEDITSESARNIGILMAGSNSIIRDNHVFSTGNGSSSFAYGIAAQYGSGLSIIDNIVTGVTETAGAYGIYAGGEPGIIIKGNQVRNISAPTSVGIASDDQRTVIQGNVISNESTGGVGIDAAGPNDGCLDNVVANFATALSGCSYSNGNRSF